MINDTEPVLDFGLTNGERFHPLWIKLSGYFNGRLTNLRAQNDGPLSEQDTATLRGQIKLLKAIIALGKDEPPIDG